MEKVYYPRIFDQILDFSLKSKGAVLIVGPKACGKSRTAERYAKTKINLLPLETRQQYLSLAKTSPHIFLSKPEKPLLIDEWQIASFLWDSIKVEVDASASFGQFILTGSVTDSTAFKYSGGEENERHTGNGRIIKKRMRTMTLFESKDSNGAVSLLSLQNGMFEPAFSTKTIEDYAYLLCRGGWPLSLGEPRDVALQQAKDYYETLVEEDIYSLSSIKLRRSSEKTRKMLRSYSRNIGSQCAATVFKEDVSCNENTLDKYLEALERLYVIDELEAWNPNLRSKTAIRSKNTRHLVDPSIACAALGITPENIFNDMKTFGFLFESLAVRDLRIYAEAIGARVYHYRDKSDREADLVISFQNGDWALVEVKMNEDDAAEAAKKLVALSNDILENKKKPSFLMIVTPTLTAYQREDGVYVVPLACLKN